MVTASHDGTARVWDASTGEQLLVLLADGYPIMDAGFDSAGRRIVTAGLGLEPESVDGPDSLPDHFDGAVRIYVRGSEWVDWQLVESPATSQTGAEFGAAVAIAEDGGWGALGLGHPGSRPGRARAS